MSIRTTSIFIFFIFIAIFDTLFFKKNDVDLKGVIDKGFVHRLDKLSKKSDEISVTSEGGHIESSEKAANIFSSNDIKIVVKNYCLSACSEYLLTSASSVVFEQDPIIGFHWNPVMNFDMLERYGGDLTYCDIEEPARLQAIYQTKGLNLDFFRETEKRLVVSHFEVVNKPQSCPWKVRHFENLFWLPTGTQLKELMGLEFNGSVCSDNFKECAKRIDRRWKKGTRIVVGDEVYISKGKF